jgi:mRNA deadenylase 3'-5' endonuclease subunit Ccr4
MKSRGTKSCLTLGNHDHGRNNYSNDDTKRPWPWNKQQHQWCQATMAMKEITKVMRALCNHDHKGKENSRDGGNWPQPQNKKQ